MDLQPIPSMERQSPVSLSRLLTFFFKRNTFGVTVYVKRMIFAFFRPSATAAFLIYIVFTIAS